MIQVPNSTPQISLNVPGAQMPDPKLAGQTGAAIADIGKTAMHTGIDIGTQLNTSEAQDASAQAYHQDRNDADQYLQQLKRNSPDGNMRDPDTGEQVYNDAEQKDPRTITQEFHSWADQRFRQSQEKMPNELAQNLYRERSRSYLYDQIGALNTDAQIMKVKSFDSNMEQRLQDHGNAIVANPGALTLRADGTYTADLTNAYGRLNDINRDIQEQVGHLYDPVTGQDKFRKAAGNVAHQVAQGAYDQISLSRKEGDPFRRQKIEAWMGVLNGEDPVSKIREQMGLPTISSVMDPIQKSNEMHKLISLLPSAQKADLTEYREGIKEHIAALKGTPDINGNIRSTQSSVMDATTQGKLAETFQLMALGKERGGINPIEGAQNVAGIYAAKAVNQTLSDSAFKSLNPAAKMAYIDKVSQSVRTSAVTTAARYGVVNPDLGAIISNEAHNHLVEYARGQIKEMKDDLPGYFQSHMDAGLKLNALDFSQPSTLGNAQNSALLQSGIKDMRNFFQSAANGDPLFWKGAASEDHKKQMVDALTGDTISTDQTVANLGGMQKGFGKYYPELIDQMVKEGKLNSGWLITKYNQSPMAVDAIRGGKNIDENFDTVARANGADRKLLEKSVADYTTPWIQANAKGYDAQKDQFAHDVTQTITRYAEKLYTTRSGGDLDTAAKDAFNEFVGQHVTTKDFGGGWFSSAKGTYTIPNSVGGQKLTPGEQSNIETNLHQLLDSEDGIKQLKGVIAPTEKNGMPATFRDKWESFVSKSAYPSSVVYSNGIPGVNIWYKSNTPETGEKDTLLYKKGPNGLPAPVFIPLDDLRKGQPKAVTPEPTGVPNPIPNRSPAGALDFLLDDDPMMREAMGMPKADHSVDNPSPYPIRTTGPNKDGDYFEWHTDPASFFGGGKHNSEAHKATPPRNAVPGAGEFDPLKLNPSGMNGNEIRRRGVWHGKA